LLEEGDFKLEHHFLDGSKIGSKANRYQWVWAKSMKKNRGKLQEKVQALVEEIERVNEVKDEEYGDRELEELGEGADRSMPRSWRSGSRT
jgi:hypothetical protein